MTFMSVTSSDLVSKWLGQGERMIKAMFDVAREQSPAIIFIDEVDALCSARGEGENEATRRMKNVILTQMDGVGADMCGDRRRLRDLLRHRQCVVELGEA